MNTTQSSVESWQQRARQSESPAGQIALALWPRATRAASGNWNTICPSHDDKRPSLSIADRPDGGLLVHCQAGCAQEAVIEALRERGLWVNGSERQTWEYRDATGTPVLRVLRGQKDGRKTYVQQRFNGRSWEWRGLPAPRPLYNLDQLAARPEAPVVVCEGEKAADAAARLFPDCVATTWSGGSKAVGKTDFSPLAGRDVTLWPDADAPGRKAMADVAHLLEAARSVRTVDLSAFGTVSEGWDAADCDPLTFKRIRYHDVPRRRPSPRLQWLSELELDLEDRSLIPGLLDRNTMAVVYGASNCGKSFFAFDVAATIARGVPFLGTPVRKGLAVYISAESPDSINTRAIGYRIHRIPADETPAPLALYPSAINLLEPDAELDRLIEMISEAERRWQLPAALVVVDTLARTMPGGDENAPEDMGRIVAAGDRIRAETGATVMFIHHSGKDITRGARGHTSLRAATDTEIEVTDDNGLRRARVTKQRDGVTGTVYPYRLEVVQVGLRPDTLTPITTCLVSHTRETVVQGAPQDKSGDRLDRILVACATELEVAPSPVSKTSLTMSDRVATAAGGVGRDRLRAMVNLIFEAGWLSTTDLRTRGGGRQVLLTEAGLLRVEGLRLVDA